MYTVFRIIPHATVLNSASRNFQRSLYELFSARTKRTAAPDFWWITQMAADSIAFYCAMPAEYAEAFRVKFRNHEQWRKSTLEIADDFRLPDANYALKYRRHDMFSLDFRYNEQTTPIRELLGVTRELSEGEAVTVYIRTETVGRAKWKKLADYAWETWECGGVPYRPGVDPARLLRTLGGLAAYLFYEVKSLIEDVMAGVESALYHGASKREKSGRPALPNPDRAELLVNGDLSATTKNKRNLPVFKTSIRCAVSSADPVKREMLARSVAGAYGAMAGDNRLELVKVNVRSRKDDGWKIREFSPNLMSVDEVGKLAQLPTADIQAEFSDILASNRRVEIELPRVFLDDRGILAGTATDRGATHSVYIPTDQPDKLFMPRAVNGSPRMGKDQHVINLVVEAKRKHGIGAIIPDFIDEQNRDRSGNQRGMADAVRDHLPDTDVIDINLADTDYAPYFGLQAVINNAKDKRIAADVIAEYLTDFLLADGDEDKFQTAEFTRDAAKVCNGDLTDMKAMFTDAAFRKRKIAELGDVFDMDAWRDYDRMSDGRQGQIYGPVLRRISQITSSEFLKPMFCQAYNPAMDLFRWIAEGKVVIIRCKIPDGIPMPERVKEMLGYWIVMLTFLIKLAQEGRGPGTFLVLNEPHQFMSRGLVHFAKRMLREGPKYKCAPIIVFHDFSAFQEYPGFVDTLLSASINWHIFRNTHVDTYKRLMPYLSRTFADPQAAFEATRQYQFIACWLNRGEYEAPFVADALPLVGKRYATENNARLTQEHARKYGRPIADVLAEIRRKRA
ncbi:hypothetical protein [uncultured Paenibacillus sp.]|uniref:hypothetical protein n=1 Tax=uncultured Paenibacillus sp. TaxID=227322 RepID=UPI0015AA301B|nr:hypothetical protein [uncultured Paenibacillus sp.]